MNLRSLFSSFSRRLSVPAGLVIVFLQRTPAVRTVLAAADYVLARPAGGLLKATAATAAALGGVHTLAGATTLNSTSNSPLSATVGSPVSVAFSVSGTVSSADSWKISGNVPPGLEFAASATAGAGVTSGLINATTLYLRGTPTTTGTYTVNLLAYNDPDGGSFQSPLFSYTVNVAGGTTPPPAGSAPVFSTQPVSQTVAPGGSVTFSAQASGTGVTFQWQKNGAAIAGANASSLTLSNLGAADAADYAVVASNGAGQATSRFARLVVDNPVAGSLSNMSVRAVAGFNGQPLIVGFVVGGGGKQVLVRAIGPTLGTQFSVPGSLADPVMEVHLSATEIVATNDDWGANGAAAQLGQVFAGVGAFPLPNAASKDSAAVITADGARTVLVNGANTSSGVVLVECYDLGGNTGSLVNVSARNRVGTGADILIAGFIVGGNTPRRLLVRALGPRLTDFGVANVLADPRLEIHTSTGGQDVVFAANDNWGDEGNAGDMNALTPSLTLPAGSKDSAVLLTVPPGAFTAQVKGAGTSTGEALVEIYDVTTP